MGIPFLIAVGISICVFKLAIMGKVVETSLPKS